MAGQGVGVADGVARDPKAQPGRDDPGAEGGGAGRFRRLCGAYVATLRAEHEWLREGSSVAQKQTIRDFGKSRAKALKDRKEKIPVKRRAASRSSASGTGPCRP